MYRGYEADWTTPRPVRPRYTPSPVPVEVLPPPDPGAMPDYQRRFPIRRLPDAPRPPVMPVPASIPPGARPFRRWPRRIPVLQILDTAKYLFDTKQALDGNLSGGLNAPNHPDWTNVCGGQSPYWWWIDLNLPFCGLGGQAVPPELINQPATGTETGIVYLIPEPGPVPDRYTLVGVFHRDLGDNAASDNVSISAARQEGTFPWQQTLPLVDAPFPLTVPWVVIPYLRNSPYAESSVRGPGVAPRVMTMAPVRPSVQTVIEISPGLIPSVKSSVVPYTPQPWKAGFGPKVRERKARLGRSAAIVAALAGGFVNVSTEANDFVVALFKALPKRSQRDFRATTSFVSPADYMLRRTAYVIAHAGEIELDQAIANVLANQIEDRAYGAYFGARRRAFDRYGLWEHDNAFPDVPRPSLEAPDI